MWDFVMDKSGAGAGFLRELRFPLPIYTPSASPQSSSLSPESANSLTNQIEKITENKISRKVAGSNPDEVDFFKLT
jgi:hypothetical protein